MAKREFLMQAHQYKKQAIGGYLASEKMDGIRMGWDGGVSRNVPCTDVPYANTAKDSRLISEQIATGGWTRYGKAIHAPQWWLDKLPKIALDGELFAGRGRFQFVSSAVRKHVPIDAEWEQIQYHCYNTPYYRYWLSPGRVQNQHMDLVFKGCWEWAKQRAEQLDIRQLQSAQNFLNAQKVLAQYEPNEVYQITKQVSLGICSVRAKSVAVTMFNKIVEEGGEGIVLSDPNNFWMPERSHYMLKMKGSLDDEGTVVGLTFGDETDKGSKLLGLMGSLMIEWKGKTFSISGFKDSERELHSNLAHISAEQYASEHPKEVAPDWIEATHFPRGTKVTFSYREEFDDGTPKEGHFDRIRHDFE